MRIDAHISEVDSIKYACGLNDLKVTVTPTPYDGMRKVSITDKGKEISPALAWYVCATANQKRIVDSEKHLSEAELSPLTDELP